MDLNSIDLNLKSSVNNSKKSNNRDWEKLFWQQQNMSAVTHNTRKEKLDINQSKVLDTSTTESKVIVTSDADSVAKDVKTIISTSGLNTTNKISAKALINTDTRVYQSNQRALVESKYSVQKEKNTSIVTTNQRILESEAVKTSMIHKDKKEIKVWTSKSFGSVDFKEKLANAFSFFGLNLVELTVRGKKN
jgi:hypothetical protein